MIAELQKQNVNAVIPFATESVGTCCMLCAMACYVHATCLIRRGTDRAIHLPSLPFFLFASFVLSATEYQTSIPYQHD